MRGCAEGATRLRPKESAATHELMRFATSLSVKWPRSSDHCSSVTRGIGSRKEVLDARGLLRQGTQEGRDQGSAAGHDEEWPPGHPGDVPRLRNQDLQDREALLALALRTREGPPTRERRPAGVGGTRALI